MTIFRVVLLGVCADHPAMCKMLQFKGVGSYITCWKCNVEGKYITKTEGGGTKGMHFVGYNDGTMEDCYKENQRTDKSLLEDSISVEEEASPAAKKMLIKRTCVNGLDAFSKHLWYFQRRQMSEVEGFHTLWECEFKYCESYYISYECLQLYVYFA